MPWDSIDKPRDEDYGERRKESRRRYKIGGRRSTDQHHLERPDVRITDGDTQDCSELQSPMGISRIL
jgi:hypothetical protein